MSAPDRTKSAIGRGPVVLAASLAACSGTGGAAGDSPAAPDAATACPTAATALGPASPLGRTAAPLSVVDRSLVGDPAAYTPDPSFRTRELELQRSQRARREVAWQIAARVLTPGSSSSEVGSALPAWQTWHNIDDLTRIFRRLYPDLSPEQQTQHARFDAAAIDAAWAWNDVAVTDMPAWNRERLDAYRSGISSAAELAGVGGVYRVAYAPAASRHWLDSYPEVLACRRSDTTPPSSATDPCGTPAATPACLDGAFPADAALVKASWTRVDAGSPLVAFDTSAAALAQKLAPDTVMDWGAGDREVSPPDGDLYTLELQNGNRFALTALHVMTKELDHWVWLTLWWSDRPDEDFGADRPPDFPEPFRNYKLCTVIAPDEADPDPSGGFAGEAPSLADALAATHGGAGGPTWCSNPYIERGPHNAATNCVGCHQHAGTALRSEDILAADANDPGSARRLQRETFPSDYVFSMRLGDDVGAMFDETADHYDP
jgi:hypothetical protein